MNISYNWLREFVEVEAEPRLLAERLTMIGLAVDAVHPAGDDSVLEVEVTSNRPDCLSHLGVAREVAALENLPLRVPRPKLPEAKETTRSLTSVEIVDAQLCPRYAARVVRGVRVGASPAWLVERLTAVGQRSVNNVADATNYVMHELGQPLHAFDLATLGGGRIVVRRAAAGEKIKTLDGVERNLAPEMLIIADAERPVAVAGVMGGEETEISAATADVLIESAFFQPDSVRRTSRELGLRSEASARFERGVDYEGTLRALDRCAQLIAELAGGEVCAEAIDVYPQTPAALVVGLRAGRVEQLTGLERVPSGEAERILTSLGFAETERKVEETFYQVPSWRFDVSIEEDLIEEVARHIGYDHVAATLPGARLAGAYQPSETRRRAARSALTALGYDEAINFSFIDAGDEDSFELIPAFRGENFELVTLENPIVEGASRMRPTLLPGLLAAVRRNFDHGTRDVALYETGRIFAGGRPKPRERESLALVATGGVRLAGRGATSRELDFYDLKGALEAACEALRVPGLRFAAASAADGASHLREGHAAGVALNGDVVIGTIGRLSDEIAARHKFRQPIYVAEIDLTALLDEAEEVTARYRPLARYPSIVRDVSLGLDRRVPLAEVTRAIEEMHVEHRRGLALIDVFEGGSVPADQRSITLRLEYRADDRSLRDDEVDAVHGAAVRALAERFGAQLR